MVDPAARCCCLGWDFSTQQVLSRPRVRAGRCRRFLCDVGRACGDLGAGTAGPSLGRNCVSDFWKTRQPSGTPASQCLALVRCVRDPARTLRSRKRRPPALPPRDPVGTWLRSAQSSQGTRRARAPSEPQSDRDPKEPSYCETGEQKCAHGNDQ